MTIARTLGLKLMIRAVTWELHCSIEGRFLRVANRKICAILLPEFAITSGDTPSGSFQRRKDGNLRTTCSPVAAQCVRAARRFANNSGWEKTYALTPPRG